MGERVQAAYLDPEQFSQFAFERFCTGDDVAQGGEHSAFTRQAYPQGDDGRSLAEMVENFQFVRGRSEVQSDDRCQVAETFDAQSHYYRDQFGHRSDIYVEPVGSRTGYFGCPVPGGHNVASEGKGLFRVHGLSEFVGHTKAAARQLPFDVGEGTANPAGAAFHAGLVTDLDLTVGLGGVDAHGAEV